MIPALIRMADDFDRRADALDAEACTLPRELSGHPRGMAAALRVAAAGIRDVLDVFRCADCGALRQQPAAAYGEDAIEGPGDPLCRDCARRTTSCPEYARYIDDGGAVEVRE